MNAPKDNISSKHGDFTLRMTREFALEVLKGKTPIDDKNGIFYGGVNVPRFSIGKKSSYGNNYFFVTRDEMYMITDDVIKCFDEAKRYLETVRLYQPATYGAFSVIWNSESACADVKLKNNKDVHVGSVQYIGSGEVKVDLDRAFVFEYSLNSADLMALNQIAIDGISKLYNPCATI